MPASLRLHVNAPPDMPAPITRTSAVSVSWGIGFAPNQVAVVYGR